MLGWIIALAIVAGCVWFVMKVHKDSSGGSQQDDGGSNDAPN